MRKINFTAPLNQLSFGNVTFNFLRELVRKEEAGELEFSFKPAGKVDVSAFSRGNEEIISEIARKAKSFYQDYDPEAPSLNFGHFNGGESFLHGSKNYLYTFHETDQLTEAEVKIGKLYDKVFVSSNFSKQVFEKSGLTNVTVASIGSDEDFMNVESVKMEEDKVHFLLIGKAEKRKNTTNIIEAWLELFGNNSKFKLHCLINNFFNQGFADHIRDNVSESFGNVTFYPFIQGNKDLARLMQSCDIDISGLSLAEGWNMPSFQMVCMDKLAVVTNASAHTEWATKDNCLLVDIDGTQEVYDDVFFKKGADFNQGCISTMSKETVKDSLRQIVDKLDGFKPRGEELANKFSYSKAIDKILL